MRKFYDSDYDRYYTIEELETQFEELKANGETDAETFEEYLDNCMYYNNGTLEEVEERETPTHHSDYFYGNKVSPYGLRNGYVDYSTLAKSFDCVLNNEIYSKAWSLGDWEQISGFSDDEDYPEIYQYYIVDSNGARILEEAEEIVFYHEDLDIYLWGVTHYGTAWDYVLTNIKIVK